MSWHISYKNMNRRDAIKIIGISNEFTQDELKKRYRTLMMVAHPDSNIENKYEYDASAINAAYEYLTENLHYNNERIQTEKHQKIKWNAPINKNAYSEREIFHNIDDSNGNILGKAVIDNGKYEWIEDEDFSLFLLSLYNCSKKIIAEYDYNKNIDRMDNMELLSDIAYLLAQQYVNKEMILQKAARRISDENDLIYQFDAMLEYEGNEKILKKGEYLVPSGIKNHRLYVKTILGKAVGYISFKDDRLYYGVIPILERHSAQVKMEIANQKVKKHNGKKYLEVDMKIKLLEEDKNHMLESINLQIDKILKEKM